MKKLNIYLLKSATYEWKHLIAVKNLHEKKRIKQTYQDLFLPYKNSFGELDVKKFIMFAYFLFFFCVKCSFLIHDLCLHGRDTL